MVIHVHSSYKTVSDVNWHVSLQDLEKERGLLLICLVNFLEFLIGYIHQCPTDRMWQALTNMSEYMF